MPNDSAMNRLLYAILSQKCLKDIDWNAVSSHPILAPEKITNGHAARMRYSRFKKQMDSSLSLTHSTSLSLSTPKPRKPRVEKAKSSPKKHRPGHTYTKLENEDGERDDVESVKTENEIGTPELGLNGGGGRGGFVKNEYGHGHGYGNGNGGGRDMLSLTPDHTSGPLTPNPAGFAARSQSPTPSSSAGVHEHSFATELDLMSSFVSGVGGCVGGDDLYNTCGGGPYGMSSGLSQEMGGLGMVGGGGLFGELQAPWGGGEGVSTVTGEGMGVSVKREDRWDEGYGPGTNHSHQHHG